MSHRVAWLWKMDAGRAREEQRETRMMYCYSALAAVIGCVIVAITIAWWLA